MITGILKEIKIYELIRKDQIVFTYFYLAADQAMIKTRSIDIAYPKRFFASPST